MQGDEEPVQQQVVKPVVEQLLPAAQFFSVNEGLQLLFTPSRSNDEEQQYSPEFKIFCDVLGPYEPLDVESFLKQSWSADLKNDYKTTPWRKLIEKYLTTALKERSS
jgi:hypothetical protein